MPKRKSAESAEQYSDEYAVLKDELQQLAERGRDDKDETSPGREIALAGFVMQSRYGSIVQTSPDTGLPSATFTSTRPDRRGNDRTQRFYLGLGAEVVTKDVVYRSENIGGRKRVISEFEATKNAPQLLLQTIESAQDAGDKIQRRIDEENYEFYPVITNQVTAKSQVTREVTRASFGARFEPVPVAVFGKFMAQIEQIVEKELGAKLDRCEILCAHYGDAQSISFADGTSVDSVMPRLSITVEVKTKSGNTTFGSFRGAGGGIEILSRAHDETPEVAIAKFAHRVAQDALDRERAQDTTVLGSEFPVVFSPHVGGVLVHEVFGHPMEADIVCDNRRSKSAKLILKSRIGAQVGNSALTIVDDGNTDMDFGEGRVFRYAWGSIPHDERGQKPKRTVLVDRGVLVNVMNDERTVNEILDGLKPEVAQGIVAHGLTGNVRRERYDAPALIRMTNTIALGDPEGPKSLEEMAALVPKNKRGLYCKTSSGGWVQPDTGDFCVRVSLGFLIENGVVTDKPVRDVNIVGNIGKFGDQIKAIGTAATVKDRFAGYCGKDDQMVPVEGASPLIYVEEVKVGSRGGWSVGFEDTVAEYLRQLDEKRDGMRKHIYLPQIDDDSGIQNHDGICFVAAALPIADEAKLILGVSARPDYERDEKEGMVERCRTL